MPTHMTAAVPSEMPGGLDAPRSPHVGRAPAFTLVDVGRDGVVSGARVLLNPTSVESHHGAVASMLVEHAVTDLIVTGIGEGMRARLIPAGVRIWSDATSASVLDAVRALSEGMLAPLNEAQVHRGHHFNDVPPLNPN